MKALRELSRPDDQIMVADVVSVDTNNDTIDIRFDNLELAGVRLRSIIDSQGNRVVVYPAVGSVVLVGRIGASNQMYVQAVGEVDKVLCRIGDMRLQVTEDGFVYNEGKHTTANADILKTELNKLSKRVDDLLDALKQASPDSSTGTFKSSLMPLIAKITNRESFSDIEDEKIKH